MGIPDLLDTADHLHFDVVGTFSTRDEIWPDTRKDYGAIPRIFKKIYHATWND